MAIKTEQLMAIYKLIALMRSIAVKTFGFDKHKKKRNNFDRIQKVQKDMKKNHLYFDGKKKRS